MIEKLESERDAELAELREKRQKAAEEAAAAASKKKKEEPSATAAAAAGTEGKDCAKVCMIRRHVALYE